MVIQKGAWVVTLKELKTVLKHQEIRKRYGAVQGALVRFLSFVCVGGTYGLIASSLVQACILVSWLKD